jgi:hypothetical protein
MTYPLAAQEPHRLGLDNSPAVAVLPTLSASQQLADTCAAHLRQGGQLRHYTINVACRNGIVELTGSVANQPQREEALRIVQGVPGVERVVNRLVVTSAGPPVTRAQAVLTSPAYQALPSAGPVLEQAPPPARSVLEQAPPPAGSVLEQAPPPAGSVPEQAPPPAGLVTDPVPLMAGPGMDQFPSMGEPFDGGGFQPEPEPSFRLTPGVGANLYPPKMPPYAWPTYAPYNNYSRVAYPQLYPCNAWPFIGPCYPFPKVPLGWRSVKLTWEDGFWWYGRTATRHDWWRLRYW